MSLSWGCWQGILEYAAVDHKMPSVAVGKKFSGRSVSIQIHLSKVTIKLGSLALLKEDEQMKNLKAIYLAPLLALLTVPAMAYHKHDGSRFENRLERQEIRIDRGVRNGELTRHEERKLRKRQHKVERMFDRFNEDGKLNKKERRKLQAALDKNSKKIKRLKHNDKQREVRVKRHYRFGYHDHDRHDHGRDVWRDYERSPFERHFWSFILDPHSRW